MQRNFGATKEASPAAVRKRGLLLRILYRVYTNYLGVTPPTLAQERTAAAFLLGGIIVGLLVIVGLVLFLWSWMAQLGAR